MKKVLFALSALALTSTSVFAADAGDGTVKFTGEIVDAACVVSPDTQKQEVVLGQVNKSVFTAMVINPQQRRSKSNWKTAISPLSKMWKSALTALAMQTTANWFL